MPAVHRLWVIHVLITAICFIAGVRAMTQELPRFNFRNKSETLRWVAQHDVSSLTQSAEGMVISISGGDPYIQGPPADYPEDTLLWMTIRLKSEVGGIGQVFYGITSATEENSIHFPVSAGKWEIVKVPVPALGNGWRLRLDPPGVSGKCMVDYITFSKRLNPKTPDWPVPAIPSPGTNALELKSGDLLLSHAPDQMGGFTLSIAGANMTVGHTRPWIGYLDAKDETRWLDLAAISTIKTVIDGNKFVMTAVFKDPDGVDWSYRQTFAPLAGQQHGFSVITDVKVSRDRRIIYLPMLITLPGAGSFGEKRKHGLFAGLEYLDAPDTSSSEADIIGPGSHRQTPDNLRVTFPLMTVQNGGKWVALTWKADRNITPLYDSPDRTFKAGGHVMGLIYPGSDGLNREEGSLLARDPALLKANVPIHLEAKLLGGSGDSVVPSVQAYLAENPLPPLPNLGMKEQEYVSWAAGGWLDSSLRDGAQYRHAYWPGVTSFAPGIAADAALYELWLAGRTNNPALMKRLTDAARSAIALVSPEVYNDSGVSHVRYPLGSLVFGHVEENVTRAMIIGRDTLGRFDADGKVIYQPAPGKEDYGRTHFENHANGLTGEVLRQLLLQAVLTGDAGLIQSALDLLDMQSLYDNSAPRGAQTWECPLHTPDILASAYMLDCYSLGYQITGKQEYLAKARYWAWTGVPFIYLVNPTDNRVGPYAGIAVFGATNWQAPDWMGLPVQWCALVYSDALYRLYKVDPMPLWKQLAEGITISGIQQSFTSKQKDLQGLLPDSFNLRPQVGNGVAINPGTVQANAVRLYGGAPMYDLHCFREAGAFVHAPGDITQAHEKSGEISFTAACWPKDPCYILISGLKHVSAVTINGAPVELAGNNKWHEQEHRLILQVTGKVDVVIGCR